MLFLKIVIKLVENYNSKNPDVKMDKETGNVELLITYKNCNYRNV